MSEFVPSWPGTKAMVIFCPDDGITEVGGLEVREMDVIGWRLENGRAKPVFISFVDDDNDCVLFRDSVGWIDWSGYTFETIEQAAEKMLQKVREDAEQKPKALRQMLEGPE
jgi:hypothetical protein